VAEELCVSEKLTKRVWGVEEKRKTDIFWNLFTK
jgi:hypothetical protein